jgi:hypothetical protein
MKSEPPIWFKVLLLTLLLGFLISIVYLIVSHPIYIITGLILVGVAAFSIFSVIVAVRIILSFF